MKCFVICLLALAGPAVSIVLAASDTAEPTLCPEGAEGIPCLGSSIAKNLVSQILGVSDNDASPRHLLDGVELVHVANDGNTSFDEATEEKGRDISSSLLNNLRKLISSYEIRVRLSELLNAADSSEAQGRKGGFGGGLGGGKVGKKGGGALLMMMMMGGMMKMMAMGALAMLAMKALTVSSLAFMLSVIVGLKKLLSKKDDDDGGHVVQVVGSGGHGGGGGGDYHRRAFLVDSGSAHQLAYRGQRRK
ncbi:hypothetical protein B566_EDAN009217 [Ephemera danica]|nr:hypothetical protein B566_EDAN009217 [Ephemera danica]